MVEALSRQRLLFASLASGASLVCLDPQNAVNSARTLVIAQMSPALIGLGTFLGFGPGYASGGTAMVATIAFEVMHPPAVATALGFALRADDASNLVLFRLANGATATLALLQRAATWVPAKHGGARSVSGARS